MKVQLQLRTTVENTPRVVQMTSIFDVPERKLATVDFDFEVPLEERDWQVGLIVGPSGAGKSSVARHLFGDDLVPESGYPWHPTRSIVDGFDPALGIRDVTEALSSVGFSSPPSWVKPYAVLSNGEKFRANMARALLDPRPLVVVDEFTSVVDRTVARVGSHALAKAVRRKPGKGFVAVTCHYDVLDWLQPDWVLEPHVGGFNWRSVQRRPPIELEYVRVHHTAWRWFAPHHYLSGDLNKSAKCFAATWNGTPVAFAALLPMPHPIVKKAWRISRVVVLPDYQGLGIAAHHFSPWLGRLCKTLGLRMFSHPAHPALIRTRAASPDWRLQRAPGFSRGKPGPGSSIKGLERTHSKNRRIASFEWQGSDLPLDQHPAAVQLWEARTKDG